MSKYKVDLNKTLYEQTWWKLLKPNKKLEIINIWKSYESQIDNLVADGEVVIDPTIPRRQMMVEIPNNLLTHKDN